MGLSRATLAIISTIAFAIAALSVVYTSLLSMNQVSSQPVLNIYAEAHIDSEYNTTRVYIHMIHDHGRPVQVKYIDLFIGDTYTRVGREQLRSPACSEWIKQGDKCTFMFELPRLLDPLKPYRGVVVFNEGTYPVHFVAIPMFKPVRNNRPLYNYTFTSVTLSSISTNDIFTNGSVLMGEGANYLYNSSGILVVDTNLTSQFGGIGFVYYQDLNAEANFSQGAWILSVFRLVNTTGPLPHKWGFGIFFDHELARHPEELIAFIGITVNSTGAFLVIERYDRDQGLEQIVASTRINISTSRLYSEYFFLASYVIYDGNLNFYRINATLYDLNLTALSSINGSFTVRLPGTPGTQWYHRIAAVVYNTAVFYDLLVLARMLQIPFIVVAGIPRDYILEITYMNNTLYRVTSLGTPIVIPATRLYAGTVFNVRYPVAMTGLLAYHYVLQFDVEEFTLIVFNTTMTNVQIPSDGETAVVYAMLPIGDGVTNVSGIVFSNITNRNSYRVNIRLTARPEYSILRNITLSLMVVDSNGSVLTSSVIRIVNGVFENYTTDWTLRSIQPGEEVYIYAQGYFTTRAQNNTLTLLLETSPVLEGENNIVSIEERPILIYLYSSS